jgi:hypothetical protein
VKSSLDDSRRAPFRHDVREARRSKSVNGIFATLRIIVRVISHLDAREKGEREKTETRRGMTQ